jgi:hypothetical protein
VVDGLLARAGDLEFCEHDRNGFALWIATRPGNLLCGFCYQAAQVLAENIRCTACGRPAGNPDTDAVVVLKIADWLARTSTCASPARITTCLLPGITRTDHGAVR